MNVPFLHIFILRDSQGPHPLIELRSTGAIRHPVAARGGRVPGGRNDVYEAPQFAPLKGTHHDQR